MKKIAFLLHGLAILSLSGCLAAQDDPADTTAKPSLTTSNDRAQQERGGWDDFPNKYKPTLLDLDGNAGSLPLPYSTRYTSLNAGNPTGLGKAAAPACQGDSTVFKYQGPTLDFFLYDTISFFDSVGTAYCGAPEGNRIGERHTRRIVEVGVGEAWETIRDSITDRDILPRHAIHGTGFIRLESGREFTIKAYDVTLLAPFGTEDVYVVDAGMELLYNEAYSIRLALARPHPYKAADFFPVKGPARHELIMTGPITHPSAGGGIDTVGFADLFDDHLLEIRDWAGRPVAP